MGCITWLLDARGLSIAFAVALVVAACGGSSGTGALCGVNGADDCHTGEFCSSSFG
jgi:hypothetical protein